MRHTSTPGARVAVCVIAPAAGESGLAGAWRKLVKDLLDPYRPELHYMRGPGPKWREKNRVTDRP